MSLDWTLGRIPEVGSWEISMRSCKQDLARGDRETKAWAHSSMAELYLLRLFTATEGEADDISRMARQHISELLDYYPRAADFPVFSTTRQLQRYVHWWGREEFVAHLGPTAEKRSENWGRVIDLANELLALLDQAIKDDADVQG